MRQLNYAKVRRSLFVAGAFAPVTVLTVVACSHPDQGAFAGASGGGGSGVSGSGTSSGSASPSGTSGSGGGTSGSGTTVFDGGLSQQITDGATPDVAKTSCGDTIYMDPWTPGYTQDPKLLQRVQTTVSAMGATELAIQMRGTPSGASPGQFSDNFRSLDDMTAGIAGFAFRDGPRGVCLNAELPSGNGYSTAFPVPSGRGATFDLALEEQIGEAIGDEMLASRTQFGRPNTMLLAPVINILRNPGWGRAEETYGEDSFLLGRMGSAFTTGAQKYVPACAKHYAGNNVENGRETDNATMDERTLREMYARHFGVLIQDGGVACVMAAYNEVNGSHSTENVHLLTDILRTDFGFKGFTMSDWWAMSDHMVFGSNFQQAAIAGLTAGLDMEMAWAFNYTDSVISSVVPSTVPLSQLQASASHILEQKYRFGIDGIAGPTGRPALTTSFDSTNSIANNASHITLARQAALESMVLLKNANNTLPIDRTKVKTVAVIGAQVPFTVSSYNGGKQSTLDFVNNVRLGDMGSSRVFSDPNKSTTPLQGITNVAGSAIKVVSGSTAAAAQGADFVVVIAGLTPQDEGEEYTGAGDRDNFELDDKNKTTTQDTLIAAVAALSKPMVVVLEGGSIVNMPWLAQVPAVVMAWYPGMDGGTAMGQLLFGDENFSGKLPVTWPKQWADEPAMGSNVTDDYHVGYSWFDNNNITPLFAFGSGLSYTTFKYDYLTVPCSTVTKAGVVSLSIGITNTGTVAGDEVAFLFVSYPSGITRPAKELKGFSRASAVPPGQTAQITIPLRVSDLKYWDTTTNSWQIQSGTYTLMVGPSSDNLTLKDTITIQ